jgi:hypothetical protein
VPALLPAKLLCCGHCKALRQWAAQRGVAPSDLQVKPIQLCDYGLCCFMQVDQMKRALELRRAELCSAVIGAAGGVPAQILSKQDAESGYPSLPDLNAFVLSQTGYASTRQAFLVSSL